MIRSRSNNNRSSCQSRLAVYLGQPPQDGNPLPQRAPGHGPQPVFLEEDRQGLLYGVSLVKLRRHLDQQARGLRNAVPAGNRLPLSALGKIEDCDHVEEIGFDLAELDRLAAESLPQTLAAKAKPLIGLLTHRGVLAGCRPEEIDAFAADVERAAKIVHDPLIVEHCRRALSLCNVSRVGINLAV